MSTATVKCPGGHSNAPTQMFCGECGLSLLGVCPEGHPNPANQPFCGECGVPIAAPGTSRVVEAEVERGELRNSHRASDAQVRPAVSDTPADLGQQPASGQVDGFNLLFWGFTMLFIAIVVGFLIWASYLA